MTSLGYTSGKKRIARYKFLNNTDARCRMAAILLLRLFYYHDVTTRHRNELATGHRGFHIGRLRHFMTRV